MTDQSGCAHRATTSVSVGSKPVLLPSRITGTQELNPSRVYLTATGGTEVAAGATLRLGAGTVIKNRTQDGLYVNGRVEIQGTDDEPAILTSYDDDASGGDSNGNGPSGPTSWAGVYRQRRRDARRLARRLLGATQRTTGPRR